MSASSMVAGLATVTDPVVTGAANLLSAGRSRACTVGVRNGRKAETRVSAVAAVMVARSTRTSSCCAGPLGVRGGPCWAGLP